MAPPKAVANRDQAGTSTHVSHSGSRPFLLSARDFRWHVHWEQHGLRSQMDDFLSWLLSKVLLTCLPSLWGLFFPWWQWRAGTITVTNSYPDHVNKCHHLLVLGFPPWY